MMFLSGRMLAYHALGLITPQNNQPTKQQKNTRKQNNNKEKCHNALNGNIPLYDMLNYKFY